MWCTPAGIEPYPSRGCASRTGVHSEDEGPRASSQEALLTLLTTGSAGAEIATVVDSATFSVRIHRRYGGGGPISLGTSMWIPIVVLTAWLPWHRIIRPSTPFTRI